MLKKVPHKRKLQPITRYLVKISIIFILTLSILFTLYFFLIMRTHLTSPLALIKKNMKIYPTSLTNTANIKKTLDKYGIEYQSAQPAQGNTTLVILPTNQEIIIDNQKDIDGQIASLQLIERQLTIEGKRFHRIDFRYDNPVVTF